MAIAAVTSLWIPRRLSGHSRQREAGAHFGFNTTSLAEFEK